MVMQVIKRDGKSEPVSFDKITSRITKLAYGLNPQFVDPSFISQKCIKGVYDGVTTVDLDNLAAETAAYMAMDHPDYSMLAARIAVSNLHKQTKKVFSDVMTDCYNYIDTASGRRCKTIADDVYEIIMANKELLDSVIIYDRDYTYDFFGFKTLERSYLLKINGKIAERPQHMLMRVSVGIHKSDITRAVETYHLMSQKFFTHASPTLFNAGTPVPQMSSCFLVHMKDDSIEGIYDTLKICAQISKCAGGIGLSIHNIRSRGGYIRGTNGTSNGLTPMLRVFNSTARYVDQGGGKRPGAFAMYLEPWHPDVHDFLDLRKNTGSEENRCRDLFLALWIPDLFMQRVEDNADWSLFCPCECPGLSDCYGEEFEVLYSKYEAEGKARKVIKAQELWFAVMEAQTETGTPYILFKDACNRKSNQKNLGTIKCSNLCTEIVEYTAPGEVAVCNLASIGLPMFVSDGAFDHKKLYAVTRVITRNLNRVIDVNFYPVEEARVSNMRHRPIGLGIQGLADVFQKLKLPFDCEEARRLNQEIMETIYFAAVSESTTLAEEEGHYETYPGSPASQGILQYDMWDVTPSERWDWAGVKAEIAKYGMRNSLLVAPMPTASTSQILGNNECFEPYTSNIYTRRVTSGEFAIVNPHLLNDLCELGLWGKSMKNRILAAQGSVQGIEEIPAQLREVYRTVWELKMRSIIDMAADRGAFIDQSQSLNLFVAAPTASKLTSMHFYSWKKGLKTGCYYLRTRPAADAIQFTVDKAAATKSNTENVAPSKSGGLTLDVNVKTKMVPGESGKAPPSPDMDAEMLATQLAASKLMCSLANPGACEMCSA